MKLDRKGPSFHLGLLGPLAWRSWGSADGPYDLAALEAAQHPAVAAYAASNDR
jgi:hypothetical protein